MFFKKSDAPLKPTFNLMFPARLNWFADEGNDELDRWLAFAHFMMSGTATSQLDISDQYRTAPSEDSALRNCSAHEASPNTIPSRKRNTGANSPPEGAP